MSEAEATIQRLAADLRTLGVRQGGVLLVHSSLSALGWVPGGPETVIQGLLAALGAEGTLLVPALSFGIVTPEHPVFDVRTTPSCIGAIAEHFRTRPGTLRSVHPSHSVCGVGPRAAELLANHDVDRTPVGPNSPFRRLRNVGGQLMFLGCGMGPNTSMHGVEEVAQAPYLFRPYTVAYTITRHDGSVMQATHRRHGFGVYDIRYERLEPLLGPDVLRVEPVLEAQAHLIEAAPMWERALDEMARDAYAFVERVG
jgi:aminoglycoside 3-N-acetyltransferase